MHKKKTHWQETTKTQVKRQPVNFVFVNVHTRHVWAPQSIETGWSDESGSLWIIEQNLAIRLLIERDFWPHRPMAFYMAYKSKAKYCYACVPNSLYVGNKKSIKRPSPNCKLHLVTLAPTTSTTHIQGWVPRDWFYRRPSAFGWCLLMSAAIPPTIFAQLQLQGQVLTISFKRSIAQNWISNIDITSDSSNLDAPVDLILKTFFHQSQEDQERCKKLKKNPCVHALFGKFKVH